MLALPATCERIFSSAKLLLAASRNCLQPDIIEANEYLRAWFGRQDSSNQTEEGGDLGSMKESIGERVDENDWDSEESNGDDESDEQSDEDSDKDDED